MKVEFALASNDHPSYHTNHVVILELKPGDICYALRYWDGDRWLAERKGEKVLAFTETDPKGVIKSLTL